MTHRHGGCSPALQIIIIVFGFIAVCLSIYGINYDHEWNKDLKAIRRSFTSEEYKLLQRDNFSMESLFVLIVGSSTILTLIHLILSLKLPRSDLYGTYYSTIFHVILICANVFAFVLMILSIYHYDQNYYKVEAHDTRKYTLKYKISKDAEASEMNNPHRIFYYCHFGKGKLLVPSELKGIRIKKTDSKLCQNLPSKCIAALLALYIAVLAYCILWFISVSDRHLEGTTLAKLFDLYGDLEEFSRDHPHHPDPAKEVFEFRQQEKYREHDIKDEDEVEDEKFERVWKGLVNRDNSVSMSMFSMGTIADLQEKSRSQDISSNTNNKGKDKKLELSVFSTDQKKYNP